HQSLRDSDPLTLRQRVGAGRDNDISLREPVSDDNAIGLVASDGNWSQRDTAGAAVDHPYGGHAVLLEESRQGERDYGTRICAPAATNTHPEAKLRRRILEGYFDRISACCGVRDRRDLACYPFDLQFRIGQRPDADFRMLAGRVLTRESRLGDVEDRILVARSRELHHHLPGIDVLTRLGADRGDETVEVSL